MINTRIRPAVPGDAPQMAVLLNGVIAAGGTTAHQTPMTATEMRDHYIAPDGVISVQVAITNGRLSGFQFLGWPANPSDPMPDGWAIIASFVALDRGQLGIGQKLWSATRRAAVAAGVQTIDATIRADNVGGLKYYGGLGFTDYAEIPNLPLSDGTPVTRIRKKLVLQA
ncbi:MAG: GNAT family N-acetyltransferase [Yoonia sp.]|nr:GNAT family N-acetyltransferase [Yoonia sp.]